MIAGMERLSYQFWVTVLVRFLLKCRCAHKWCLLCRFWFVTLIIHILEFECVIAVVCYNTCVLSVLCTESLCQ